MGALTRTDVDTLCGLMVGLGSGRAYCGAPIEGRLTGRDAKICRFFPEPFLIAPRNPLSGLWPNASLRLEAGVHTLLIEIPGTMAGYLRKI